jgi:hypothetical protein
MWYYYYFLILFYVYKYLYGNQKSSYLTLLHVCHPYLKMSQGDRRGRDRMVIGLTISAYHQ